MVSSRAASRRALAATAKRWAGKGSWAILDQGLFAISNFGLNVLLARWLAPADYGAFSVAYTIFLLLGTFHTALLSEPMLVFGSGKHQSRVGAYLKVVLRGHWVFATAVGALLAGAGITLMTLGIMHLAPALLALAGASPFILFQWLMRRACYLKNEPRLAANTGLLYLGFMVLGVVGLRHLGELSVAGALLVMAVASLFSGLCLVYQLGVNQQVERSSTFERASLGDHWRYGRWALGASGLGWAAGNTYFVVLPFFTDLTAVGTLRAAFNFIMPVMQVFTALGTVLLPELVKARRERSLRKHAWMALALFTTIAIVYSSLTIVFSKPLSLVLYGNSFPSLSEYISVLAFLPLSGALVSVLGSTLRALERTRAIFLAYLSSTLVTLTLGTLCIYSYGALGAAIGMVAASCVTGSLFLVQILRPSHISVPD